MGATMEILPCSRSASDGNTIVRVRSRPESTSLTRRREFIVITSPGNSFGATTLARSSFFQVLEIFAVGRAPEPGTLQQRPEPVDVEFRDEE